MNMKDMKELISEAARTMGELGLAECQKSLEQEGDRLSREKYKIAVIGQFKVGKSTLINKVFLKKNVLFTDLLEATCVPTEIEYGDLGRLEVYPYLAVADAVSSGSTSKTFRVPAEEGAPQVINDPGPEDVKLHTAADTDEQRQLLARQTSRVRLLFPAESLKGLMVVDTPGINSSNEAVVATTYRVIPDADLTVFITRPMALNEIDVGFLRSRVFDHGVARCLAVVSYDPEFENLNEAKLGNILDAIKAQLAGIGRAYVPVVRLNMHTKAGGQSIGEALASEDSGADPTVERDSLAAFEKTLLCFIRENALPGRLERAQSLLRRELEKAKLECQVEINALAKTDEEKASLRKRIQFESDACQQRYARLREGFLQELSAIKRLHLKAITNGLDTAAALYIAKFDQCQGLGDVRSLLQRVQVEIQSEVENVVFQAQDDARQKIGALEQKYKTEIQESTEPWTKIIVDELQIDGGVLSKIPSLVLWTADIIISEVLLPGGAILDLILRGVLSKIPFIKDVLPVNVARVIMISSAKDSIREGFDKLRDSTRRQLDERFADTEVKIRENWEANGQEQQRTILEPLERSMNEERDPKRAQILKSALVRIEGLLTKAV